MPSLVLRVGLGGFAVCFGGWGGFWLAVGFGLRGISGFGSLFVFLGLVYGFAASVAGLAEERVTRGMVADVWLGT